MVAGRRWGGRTWEEGERLKESGSPLLNLGSRVEKGGRGSPNTSLCSLNLSSGQKISESEDWLVDSLMVLKRRELLGLKDFKMILRVTTAQLQLLSDYYCWKEYADRDEIKD
ncbi:hypothetical protein Tco_1044565 [Tanacetum coccineum]|uniref:Uncharacterized protein n=1 Tax=Tanacetum coccineum TaxID=301880 RepID=A0ABQ5GQB7_9ASTR